MPTEALWTVIIYLAGDNNLSQAGEQDLAEMRTVGSSAQVNVVVEFDRQGNERETERYHVERDGTNERVVSLGETDCGDPDVLVDFVRWAAQEYPAEHYALILWSHGGGWAPTEVDRIARGMNTPSYYGRESTDRSAGPLGRVLFRTTWEKIMGLGSVEDRAICSDDGSGHSLDTIELGNVLARATERLGQPLDLLGMDACLMSNLEVAYQAQPYVRHIVASEEKEPNQGWPYDRVLRFLVDNPDVAAADLAAHIVDVYVKYYTERNHDGPITQSALDLSRLDLLTAALDRFAPAMVPNMAQVKYDLNDALSATTAKFWGSTLWDIGQLCQELAGRTTDAVLRQAALEVKAVLQPKSAELVIAEGHSGTKVAQCSGITIYLPPKVLAPVSRYYGELAFAKEHEWANMLAAYQKS